MYFDCGLLYGKLENFQDESKQRSPELQSKKSRLRPPCSFWTDVETFCRQEILDGLVRAYAAVSIYLLYVF